MPIDGESEFSKRVFPCPVSLWLQCCKVRSELHEKKQGQGRTWFLRGRRIWSFERGRICVCVCNEVFVCYFLYKNVFYILKKYMLLPFGWAFSVIAAKKSNLKAFYSFWDFSVRVLIVTESPFFEDFCNEYQQLTPYGVIFFFAWVNFIDERACFKLDTSRVWYAMCMPCCCYQIFTGLWLGTIWKTVGLHMSLFL